MLKAAFVVRWSDEDSEYVATCTDFPSLSWLDENPVEALRGLLRVILDTMECTA